MSCIDICEGETVSQVKYLDFGSARGVARDTGTDVIHDSYAVPQKS